MLLGFQKQFVEPIQDGTKPFTIRALRKDGRIPRPGESLYMYAGLRTKNCRRIFPQGKEPVRWMVGTISILAEGNIFLDIDHLERLSLLRNDHDYEIKCEITPHCFQIRILNIDKFAYMDGHKCFADMLAFFKKVHGLPFTGNIIFWKLHPEWIKLRGQK